MCSGLANKLTVCDTKPGLAKAFAEELHHATVSCGIDVEIVGCEKDEEVQGADVILVSAGEPRLPGIKITRRDLATKNGRIMKTVAEATAPRNPKAKYVVITNPVDAMAMIFNKYSGADEDSRQSGDFLLWLPCARSNGHVQGWPSCRH